MHKSDFPPLLVTDNLRWCPSAGPVVLCSPAQLVAPVLVARGTLSITTSEIYFEVNEDDPAFKRADAKVRLRGKAGTVSPFKLHRHSNYSLKTGIHIFISTSNKKEFFSTYPIFLLVTEIVFLMSLFFFLNSAVLLCFPHFYEHVKKTSKLIIQLEFCGKFLVIF